MPTDEKPQSKYQCLLEAASNAGLQDELPPIKPGTEAKELAPTSNINDVSYEYESTNGRTYSVYAQDIVTPAGSWDKPARTKGFLISRTEPKPPDWPQHLSPPMDSKAFDFVNVETGKVGTEGDVSDSKRAKPGTVETTVDKFFKCRDPRIS